MIVITTPLGAVGLVSVIYLGIMFTNFSRRLGTVTRMSDHYSWFWVATGFITLATMSQIVLGIADLAPDQALSVLLHPWFSLITYHIPLAIGVTIDLVLVWYYWRWILKEKVR
ncbi:MAG TPA: hypothetical protein ENN99_05375 [Chloroflexi bacterium]|nr:hypothetical protein [Chloroflexota bacterium]